MIGPEIIMNVGYWWNYILWNAVYLVRHREWRRTRKAWSKHNYNCKGDFYLYRSTLDCMLKWLPCTIVLKYVSYSYIKNVAWFYKGGKCGCFVLINKWCSWVQSTFCAIQLYIQSGSDVSINWSTTSFSNIRLQTSLMIGREIIMNVV